MKKLSFLMFALAATMMLSAQTFKVTWNLDGGATNQYGAANKSELFNAFMTDAGVASFETLEYYMQQDDPLGAPNICTALANAAPALKMEKWAWLKAYIEKAHADQAADGASALPADGTGAAWRYAVGAFFISGQRATWPKSADFTELGKDEVYGPVMNAAGQYYAYPAEVATDYVLPIPFKTGYTFLGWYNGETKVDAIAADVELTAKWEVVKYNVTWDLDGGKLPSTNKSELFNEFMKDAGVANFETLEYYMQQADPLSAPNICSALTDASPALKMEKWAWLKAYIEKAHADQAAAGASALPADGTGGAWRYAVGAFFISGQRASWPKSADFTELGKDEVYVPVMNAAGMFYELPAQYSIDMPLPTPVKAEHNFLGWYNGTKKVEAVDADMTLTANWERAVYNVDFVAPFAYPNPMYAVDKDGLYANLNEDYDTFYKVNTDWGKLSTFTGITDGMPTKGGLFDLTFFADSVMGAKWGWLLEYCDTIVARANAEGAGLTVPSTNASFMRYNVNAFFMNSVRPSWPKSADYATCGIDAENQEWKKFWGYDFALVDTIAEDYTLPAMYRKNYEFKGWYWNADFSGEVVTVVPVKSNGTLYAKFEPTGYALLGIELSKKDTVELQMPATDSLYVIYTPDTAANKNVTWSSSDENVLVVENGVVTPKGPGVATVKVVSEESELKASVVYNVSAAPGAVTGVTLDKTELTLPLGETATLVATIAPDTAYNKQITWASSGNAVSVDSLGVIKADTVGSATITVTTVDGGYTATCKVTVPEPINADVKVEKLWEIAIDTKTADIDDVRNGMGFDGKFYLTQMDYNNATPIPQMIRVFTKDGEDTEAAIALNAADMTVIDSSLVQEPTVYTLGTAIAIDDAGNIVFGTNFSGNVKALGIIKKGEKKPTIIEVTLPTTGRTDQITAFGDIFSAEGGLVALYPKDATQVQLVKIANGQLVEAKALAGTVKAGASPSQVLYATETEAWVNARGSSMQYVKDSVVTDITPKNVITNDLGGARMVIGGNEVYAYKVGTVHSSEFAVRNMTAGQFAADKDGNTVHYVVDTKAASNNSYANFTKAEKINDYAYYLYVFTSGKGAGVFKVYQEVAVESIALDQATATVKAGEKLQLTATVTPSYATVQDVVWSTSDSAIAIVDQNGLVQAVKAGEATITATTVDGGKVAECALTVEAVYYHRAMSVAELKAGKKMLIVNAGDTLAMAQANKNNFGQVAIAPVDGVLSDVPAEATIITIEQDSVFAFAVEGGYIYAGTSSSNYLRVQEQRDELAEWNITIDEKGLANIVCHSSKSKRNTIRYNKQSELFSAYAPDNTQEDVVIFVEFDPNEEPKYQVVEDEITNLVIDLENMAITGGPSKMWQVNVSLGLAEDDNMDGKWSLSPESSVTVMGFDARIIDGYVYDIDVNAPAAKAVLRVEDSGFFYEYRLTMTNTPTEAIVVVIEDATVAVNEVEPFPGAMKEYSLKMTADWTYAEDGVTYPVLVEVPVYYPEATEPSEILCTVTIGGTGDDDPWLGFGEGTLTITTVEGVVTAKGIVVNPLTGVAFDVTVSGKLPETAVDNIQVGVQAAKVLRNGQLIIIKNDVEYNAQGAVVK